MISESLVRMMLALAVLAVLLHISDAGDEVIWTKVDSASFVSMTPYSQPAVKNKRHCHYLCTVEATCKSMQYNTISSVCSLYAEEAVYLIPEDSGDTVSFASPRLSVKWGTWYTVLRSTAGTGVSVYDTWMSTGGYNDDQVQLASRQSTPAGIYKSALIDSMWGNVLRVKVSVYISGVEQFFVEHDASGSDKSSWFASHKLISSSVVMTSTSYYTMNGHCGRNFYIVTHAGCDGDWGYLAMPDAGVTCTCSWDLHANPRFLFSNNPGGDTTASGMTAGDVFMIQVMM